MHTFEFIRPADPQRRLQPQRGRKPRSKAPTCASWEADDASRPDEAERRNARHMCSTSIACRSTRSKNSFDGGLKIGATVRNSDLATHREVLRDYAVLSQAILSGASGQFAIWPQPPATWCRERAASISAIRPCPAISANRERGCPAITGSNRTLAVLGTSDHCIATNPSDMCVAMAALEASIHVEGPRVPRRSPSATFICCPATRPIVRPCLNRATLSRTSRCRRRLQEASKCI